MSYGRSQSREHTSPIEVELSIRGTY